MALKFGKFLGYTGAFVVSTFFILGASVVLGAYTRFVWEAFKLGYHLGR